MLDLTPINAAFAGGFLGGFLAITGIFLLIFGFGKSKYKKKLVASWK